MCNFDVTKSPKEVGAAGRLGRLVSEHSALAERQFIVFFTQNFRLVLWFANSFSTPLLCA